MNQTQIEKMLINIVCNLQELSGREKVEISAGTRPIEDVPGFDSLNCVEATIEAIDQLDKNLDFNNVFFDDNKSLTIQQAAVRLLSCITKQPAKQG